MIYRVLGLDMGFGGKNARNNSGASWNCFEAWFDGEKKRKVRGKPILFRRHCKGLKAFASSLFAHSCEWKGRLALGLGCALICDGKACNFGVRNGSGEGEAF